MVRAYSSFEVFGPCNMGLRSPWRAGIGQTFGPKIEFWIFLSAKGVVYTSLGQSPRKWDQYFGHG
jgi:hypothetical protein